MAHDPISSWAIIQILIAILLAIIGWLGGRTLIKLDRNQDKMFGMIEVFSAQLNKLQGEHDALKDFHQTFHPAPKLWKDSQNWGER